MNLKIFKTKDKSVESTLPGTMQEDAVRLLFLSSLAACAMLTYRVMYTGSLFYVFLAWNLFLGWIPYLLSLLFTKTGSFAQNKIKVTLLFAAWVCFLPNSPYMLTDLVHLCPRPAIPMWFDLLLILMFAWTGLMLGLISMTYVHNYISANFKTWITRVMLAFILVSCSFGIYVGRYLRWNSWDIVFRPFDLMKNLSNQFLHPFHHPATFGMTLSFSVFLGISYYTLTVFSKRSNRES